MTEVKRGMLKYYHRGLLNKKWKEYKFILYDSSLLTWYTDVKHKKPDGMILLKDVERYICVGPYTRFLPDFPHLESEYDQVALIAFPISVKERDRDIVWLLCEDINDLNSWMKAIVQTLPSHALCMEQLPNRFSSPSMDENTEINSELISPEINSPDPLIFKVDTVGLPLATGLIGTRLQGHNMNSKDNPLKKAGYDYGDTLWGTGEGWGHFSPLEVPGFAAMGGSGCYSNHIDLIRNHEDEQQLKNVEDNIDDEETIEEITYELSKNEIEDDKEEKQSIDSIENEEEKDRNLEQIEEDLQMIDHDTEE